MSQNKQEKSSGMEPFFIVPSAVFDKGLTPYELAVLFYLCMRADNKTHTCFPSEKGIARACGTSYTSVRRALKRLSEKRLISVNKHFMHTPNGTNRQTSNHYTILFYGNTHSVQMEHSPCSNRTPPLLNENGEINKTISNITKPNITISTELTMREAQESEKERKSFLKLRDDCFEKLRRDEGLEEEYIVLLERALEHLWYKKESEYEGKKYPQSELQGLLATKMSPIILSHSVEYLGASSEPVRSPVAYLAKCILGGLVRGDLPDFSAKGVLNDAPKEKGAENTSFELDDFFAAALRNTYDF